MKRPATRVALLVLFWFATVYGSPVVLEAQDADYIRQAAQGAIFVYDAGTKPCAPPVAGQSLLPLGSGFVVGIPMKSATDSQWRGWKFLVTTHHVVGNRSSIILRLNQKDRQEFICYDLKLERDGQDQNIFASDRAAVDLVVISIPDIPNADPTVFDYSLILDERKMSELEIREGTDVFTVGYLYGYSGNKQNFPITKFGKVALLTQEGWYHSQRSRLEQAYLVELQNTPGLSGAPVMVQSPQFRVDHEGKFQFRRIPPFVVGVVKGLLVSPIGPQGVAAIEPASHLRDLMKKIADGLKSAGFEVQLEPTTPAKK